MESEVLGPLRIWHLVFIIAIILLIVVTIVCCCCDFRLPRTRQEIEENFQKRILNKQYLSVLERRPQELIKRQRGGISVTKSSQQHPVRQYEDNSIKTNPRTKANKNQQKYEAKTTKAIMSSKGVKSSRDRSDEISGYSPVRRPKKMKDTPLATHPRDILALMTQHT